MQQIIDFEDDLLFVANKVTKALNMFNETYVSGNKLVTMYGDEDFIALFVTPDENSDEFGSLRLRTRDMGATWNNVPLGFSQINESRGLLADMKRAAHVSLKRNSVWYIDSQIKDTVGDRVVFTELTTNRGYLYKVAFTNGYVAHLSITRDDKEYYKPHDEALLYFIVNPDKTPISPAMTADECILMLINIAMQTDIRVAEFVSKAEQSGGKTSISNSYRTEEESFDEAKAVFKNGYALKLTIKNGEISVEILGRSLAGKTYLLDVRIFDAIDNVYELIKEIAVLEQYVPNAEE